MCIVQCACTVVLQDKIIPTQSRENMRKEIMQTDIHIFEERNTKKDDS
jgi:hypothetical protein